MSAPGDFVQVEIVARCYDCEVGWLIEVHARGFLPRTPSPAPPAGLAIALADLDRVAALVRWHRLGVDLDLLELLWPRP